MLLKINQKILEQCQENSVFTRRFSEQMELMGNTLEKILTNQIVPSRSTIADAIECLRLGDSTIPFNENLSREVYEQAYTRTFMEPAPKDITQTKRELRQYVQEVIISLFPKITS